MLLDRRMREGAWRMGSKRRSWGCPDRGGARRRGRGSEESQGKKRLTNEKEAVKN